MSKTRPALALVIGGVLCGAVMAQAVPTDPVGTSPRPWKPAVVDAYPEIVGIAYETLPGAASDPYNFTPHRSSWRTADVQYQLPESLPGYQEPRYEDDDSYDRRDPQIVEEDEQPEYALEEESVVQSAVAEDEMPTTSQQDQSIG